MATVTWDVLRGLASFHSPRGCAVTIYADLDPSVAPTAGDLETRINSLVSEASKLAEAHCGNHDCRTALRSDIERVRRWWESEFDRDGVRGLAVFASSLDGLFRTLPLDERVPDAVHLGPELTLRPLAPLAGRENGTLVAVVSREEGRLFRVDDGRLGEIADETEEQPGQHDQGGWSQARYQRHIEKLVHDHLRTVGDELDRETRLAGHLQLVIVAPEEMRGEIESTLSSEVRHALLGWATADARATPTELLEVVRPLLDEAHARREQQVLGRWVEARGRGGRAAAGWEQTLEAVSDSRVGLLLLEDGANHEAWQCPKCGRAAARSGECPLDGTAMEPRPDGADLAIHLTLVHGGTVGSFSAGALGDAEGIGALLRF